MIKSVTEIVVRYAETDMMGLVYHANYLPWLEIGRTQLLRENGLPYKEIEERGLFIPVLEVNLQYKRPARYDDTISIVTRLAEKPLLKIRMEYEVMRGDELLAKGHTLHAFMNREGMPERIPEYFKTAIAPFFE